MVRTISSRRLLLAFRESGPSPERRQWKAPRPNRGVGEKRPPRAGGSGAAQTLFAQSVKAHGASSAKRSFVPFVFRMTVLKVYCSGVAGQWHFQLVRGQLRATFQSLGGQTRMHRMCIDCARSKSVPAPQKVKLLFVVPAAIFLPLMSELRV